MRQVLEILRDTGTGEDEWNDPAENFPVHDTIRGAIKWIDGREQAEQGAQVIIKRALVTIRYYASLTEMDKLRIKGTGRVLNIEHVVTPDERPHLMEVTVVERK